MQDFLRDDSGEIESEPSPQKFGLNLPNLNFRPKILTASQILL
jgi:hypothetical protein